MTAPEPPQLRGQLLLSRLEHLREAYGEDARDAVLAQLTEPEQQQLANLAREAWYPLRLLIALDHAASRVLAAGDPGIYERLGAASARHRTEWIGEHFALVSPHAFLSRVAEQHRQFHTFGRAAYRRLGFEGAEIAFSEYPDLDASYCRSALGYLKRSVELLTDGPAAVVERECQLRGDPACVFAIRWGGKAGL